MPRKKNQTAPILSASDFLASAARSLAQQANRIYPIREGLNLVRGLRMALVDKNHLQVDEALTRACYHYLSLVNRTPVLGYSFLCPQGTVAYKYAAGEARLQAYVNEITDGLRSGTIKPDTILPEYYCTALHDFNNMQLSTLITFDIPVDLLDSTILSNSTTNSLSSFLEEMFILNPDVPESFIEAFILAHAYLYRLSLVD